MYSIDFSVYIRHLQKRGSREKELTVYAYGIDFIFYLPRREAPRSPERERRNWKAGRCLYG